MQSQTYVTPFCTLVPLRLNGAGCAEIGRAWLELACMSYYGLHFGAVWNATSAKQVLHLVAHKFHRVRCLRISSLSSVLPAFGELASLVRTASQDLL